MDDQFDLNLRNPLNLNQPENVDSLPIGDQRKSLPPGQMIDNRFRVIRELGRGGTGTVYQVEQILLKREFAMKVLDPIQVTDESWRRFQKEAQAAGRLDHPGFVKVHDFGLMDNQIPYFTMDLVSGDTLAERLRKQGSMSVATALPIFIQLCFALDYAHSQGVIHRDVKPSNISLMPLKDTSDEQVKILDFGIAKLVGVDTTSLTQVGSVFGTPFYMSPEQCMGQPVDLRSDIYSLGCVFYEMLTSAPPFTTANALTLMMQHQSDSAPSLKEASMGGQFPAELEALIQKMLSKNPNERYQRLVDTANDLINLQQGKAPSATIAKKIEEGSSRRKNKYIQVVAAVLLTAIVGTGLFYMQAKKQPDATASKTPVEASSEKVAPAVTPEEETVEDFDNHFKVDYADVVDEYFSSAVQQNGLSYRVFKFPKKDPIGDVEYYDIHNEKHVVPAMGKIFVPRFPTQPSIISMTIDWKMCKTSPQLLKKFRPDEIGGLKFTDDDYRKTLATDDIFDDTLSFVDNLTSIYAIELPAVVTNKCAVHLAKLTNLKFLDANRTGLSGDELVKFPALPHIKGLKISMIKNARVVLPILKRSQSLMWLKVVADDLQDSDLKNLADLPALEELALRDNPKITDQGLTYLVGLPHLQRISLDGCHITPKSITTLRKMNVSDFISLDVSNWSKADVAALRKAVSCRVLTWDYKNQEPRTLDDAAAAFQPPRFQGIPVQLKKAMERGE